MSQREKKKMTKANFINSSYIESVFIRKGIDFSKKKYN